MLMYDVICGTICYEQSSLSLACLYNNFKVKLNTIQFTPLVNLICKFEINLKNLHLCHVLIYYELHPPQGNKRILFLYLNNMQ